MKLANLFMLATALTATANAVAVHPADAHITDVPTASVNEDVEENVPRLEKRYKGKIINKEYQKLQEEKQRIAEGGSESSTSEKPKNWVRTIYDGKVEIVTPTVIAGVTFSAKPPKTTDPLQPWISLNKDGSPKTIKPQLKNGQTKKASPTYDTWFATATTKVYTKQELQAHNMEDDQIHEEVEYIDEDLTYQSLNPLLRCTPDWYGTKGLAKDTKTEPFCFPRDNAQLKRDKTYFVTWYSRYFAPEVKNVRLHLSYVKEKAMQKGLKKRDTHEELDKRSSVIENGGTIQQASFYTSDWVANDQGFLPITIDPEWFGPKDFHHKVLLSLQPDNVSDEDFDLMEKHIVVEIMIAARVSKEHLTDLKKLEEKWRKQQVEGEIDEIIEGIDYEKYIVMLTMPTCVALAALGMYLFVWINKRNTDLSHLKKRSFAGKKTDHRRIPFKKKSKGAYAELPQYSNDIEMTKRD